MNFVPQGVCGTLKESNVKEKQMKSINLRPELVIRPTKTDLTHIAK